MLAKWGMPLVSLDVVGNGLQTKAPISRVI